MAQSCNPATGGQEYWDELVIQVSINLVEPLNLSLKQSGVGYVRSHPGPMALDKDQVVQGTGSWSRSSLEILLTGGFG